ncbi:MAG TPA: isoprenylcysteine carboxylmethyltransferase family protein, partial [Microvirga sp.]|nr:isoprenylcysteine carboxylmethyltransferase family protein [Microvirga sp.]
KTAGGFDRIVMPDRARVLRVSIKLIGLMGTYALLALAYWALPIYRKEFPHFFSFVVPAIPALLLAAPFYLWLTDRRMSHPADGCFMAGLLVLGRTNEVDGNVLQDYAAGWLVKGFFAPIMFHAAFEDVQWFLSADFGRQLVAPYGWFDLPLRILYGVDVVWGGTGYLLTLRLFQTHVRSANPALDGWLVCVVCYAPIWGLIYRNYLRYEDGLTWVYWLSDHPTLRTAWGVAILILIGIYCWATLSFGARFSNLTHRGIVTNGPYRWSKHPAYVAKNLSWWLISMPFLSQAGASEAIRLSLLLLCVNAIYYWRAKTEERHLATDPVYAEYARWISEHGLAARRKRWLSRTLLQSRRPDRSVM